jgi:hypothetical protein
VTKTIERRLADLEQEARQVVDGPTPEIIFNNPEQATELKARGVQVTTMTVGGLDLRTDV